MWLAPPFHAICQKMIAVAAVAGASSIYLFRSHRYLRLAILSNGQSGLNLRCVAISNDALA